MTIRLEIPRAKGLPSQGRNADSNSAGSATASGDGFFAGLWQWLGGWTPSEGCSYRVWMEPGDSDSEFVHFVGWSRSRDKLIFEDGQGDLHTFTSDEIEVV